MPSNAAEGQPARAPRWWFVYYRVKASELHAALAAARAAQQSLRAAHPGLEASLMQRPEPDAQQLMTVMETYRAAPEWPAAALQALPEAIEATAGRALAPWLQGLRHLEVFEPCA